MNAISSLASTLATSAAKKAAVAKQTTKPAAKKAAPAKVATKKATSAPAKKASAAKAPTKTAQAKAPAVAIKYAIEDFARPTAGASLAAHTAAFLALSGMTEGKATPRALASRVIGPRAIAYHLSIGNFETTSEGLALTAKGHNFMSARTVDAEKVAAYAAFFKDGKVNDSINVKSAGHVVKV